MRKIIISLLVITIQAINPIFSYTQIKSKADDHITSTQLESHVRFLASPLLKGRKNGEEGLDIAAQYIASQAKLSGLIPANGQSYFQPYTVIKKSFDLTKTTVMVISDKNDTVKIEDPFYQLIPLEPSDFILEGEVIFAGYGIKAEKYNYNDFDSIKTKGNIIMVMDRAPMSEDGTKYIFEESIWSTDKSFQMKLTNLIFSGAKAILVVADPKSGHRSLSESQPEFVADLCSMTTIKGAGESTPNPYMSMIPKVIFINRSVADALLDGSGHTLEELQKTIDSALIPQSFVIKENHIKITEVSASDEKKLVNVAAYIEGSDPVLKKEVIVFSGHYDHIGSSDDNINPGADDDASGCAALLSLADAFQNLPKKPSRSMLFLWVSGEEIGLLGSKSYVENPLFPLENTVADLNIDMIGRVKGVADSTQNTPMTEQNTVFVITGNQSKELRSIADEADKKSQIDFDYSLSGKDNPLQLFARSDHYSFVRKDIPVLFFTTGLHSDYHTAGDTSDKIDFDKMELITKTIFHIGLTIANNKKRLTVDNPYSSWGKNK